MPGHNGWLVCPRTQAALRKLEGALHDATAAEDPQLEVMARYLIARGGKRLRPTLLFLAATYGSCAEDTLLQAATALELIHAASLYHDDIMDRSIARRGDASVNARWGNSWASIAGTYLFARACAIFASLGEGPNQLAAQTSVALCTGQLQEVENAYNLDLTEEEHLQILARKTATLFELPCRLGASLGNVSVEHCDALIAYGHHLGLAFQITDDALDIIGDAVQLGKATAADLREGIYSLPLLRVLHRGGTVEATLRSLLGRVHLSNGDINAVLRLVIESGAVSEALDLARSHIRQAQTYLIDLPDTLARYSLMGLADFVSTRSN